MRRDRCTCGSLTPSLQGSEGTSGPFGDGPLGRMGHGTSGTGSGTLRFSATEETMPDATRLRRNDPRRLIAVVVSAVLWLVVLVGAAGPVAATDPSAAPSTAPSSAPS